MTTLAPQLERAALLPVDEVDVTILVDNVVDINLPGTDVALRPPRHYACDGASRKRGGRARFSPGRGGTAPLLRVTSDPVEMQHGHCVPTTSHSRS